MTPLIGISAHKSLVPDGVLDTDHHVVMQTYVKAVRKAGGLPVLLPLVEPEDAAALLGRVDGLLMTGGGDIDPSRYGAEPDPRTVRVNPDRDARDIALCEVAVDRDLPTLAICRGIQVLNVATGGSLVQHVDDHFDLDRYNDVVHKVDVEPSSALARRWLGATSIGVNTLHHQAVASTGAATVVAHADDGTVEGIEVSPRVVGVQWHPEMLRHRPDHLALFESLVRLASP